VAWLRARAVERTGGERLDRGLAGRLAGWLRRLNLRLIGVPPRRAGVRRAGRRVSAQYLRPHPSREARAAAACAHGRRLARVPARSSLRGDAPQWRRCTAGTAATTNPPTSRYEASVRETSSRPPSWTLYSTLMCVYSLEGCQRAAPLAQSLEYSHGSVMTSRVLDLDLKVPN
jgi:hypothetical protein